MTTDIPTYYTTRYRTFIPGHPLLRILVSFPIACFTGALATDIAYASTANVIWADFSDWLLAAGIIMGVFAAIAGLVALIANRRAPVQPRVWPTVIGSAFVLILALFDNLVHSRDAWTSVVPQGLVLSALTVIAVLITAWLGSASFYRAELPGAEPYAGDVRP